ncbi:hypothetical protein RB653_010572 [Dictyostelium firmibasis]|uniref:Uncharacterized protein n=1 Tax=Dictyostelium firmibasis TaxID=79012 RepID=A0AAN7YL65_9MYCE
MNLNKTITIVSYMIVYIHIIKKIKKKKKKIKKTKKIKLFKLKLGLIIFQKFEKDFFSS